MRELPNGDREPRPGVLYLKDFYVVSPFGEDWLFIGARDGEGGGFDAKAFEEHVRKFFVEHF